MADSSDSVCHSCGARVLWCLFPDRRTRPVEDCPEGIAGDVAILPSLFPGSQIEARKVSTRTKNRLHLASCPQAEHWRAYMKLRGMRQETSKPGAK